MVTLNLLSVGVAWHPYCLYIQKTFCCFISLVAEKSG